MLHFPPILIWNSSFFCSALCIHFPTIGFSYLFFFWWRVVTLARYGHSPGGEDHQWQSVMRFELATFRWGSQPKLTEPHSHWVLLPYHSLGSEFKYFPWILNKPTPLLTHHFTTLRVALHKGYDNIVIPTVIEMLLPHSAQDGTASKITQ